MTLHPGPAVLNFAAPFAWASLEAKVDAPLAGYAKTRLSLEIYEDDGSPNPPPIAPGDFTLGVGTEASYETCQHCVLLVTYDPSNQPRRVFFQASGRMTISDVDVTQFGLFAGEINDVHLTEVTQAPDLSWHPVEGGLCFDVPHWTFDNRPVDGTPCESVEDCQNESMQICDVATKTCQPAQCSLTGDPPFCSGDEICLSQLGAVIDVAQSGPAIGACYPTCLPGDPTSCEAGKSCVALGPTQQVGICLAPGSTAIGQPCDGSDVSTGCVEGAICTGEVATCSKLCDYLTASSGCPVGTYCSLTNVCRPLDTGDLALVGEPCNSASPELSDCAAQGDAFRGICMKFFPSETTLTCERLCRTDDPTCPGQQTCLPVFSNSTVGVCHDIPVCGDGVVDVIGGENCDDGNTLSGDGCDGLCFAAELAPLCDKALPLTLDAYVVDTTEQGIRGYGSSCDPFIATPTKTYSFLPPAPGRLTLNLDSVHALGLSVLGDCADNTSELKCVENQGSNHLTVDVAGSVSKPWLIVVRGQSPLDVGQFGLFASFSPSVCGDHQVSGPEACDDGNNVDNDGCSADCSAIEWQALCASLPVLGPVNNGDLTQGLNAFDSTGECAAASGGGLSRAYSFTAPSSGTLSLSVSSPQNVVLFVETSCMPVDPNVLLTCANSAFAGETESTQVQLAGGDQVTVVVQGFTESASGSFTLQSQFSP